MVAMFGVVSHQILREPNARIETASHILVNGFSFSHNALDFPCQCIETRYKSREDVSSKVNVVMLFTI